MDIKILFQFFSPKQVQAQSKDIGDSGGHYIILVWAAGKYIYTHRPMLLRVFILFLFVSAHVNSWSSSISLSKWIEKRKKQIPPSQRNNNFKQQWISARNLLFPKWPTSTPLYFNFFLADEIIGRHCAYQMKRRWFFWAHTTSLAL